MFFATRIPCLYRRKIHWVSDCAWKPKERGEVLIRLSLSNLSPASQVVEVPFSNPFPEDCLFSLSLIHSAAVGDPPKPAQRAVKSSDPSAVTSWSALPHHAFWIKGGRDKIKTGRGQSLSVNLIFLPFRFAPQVTNL